MIRVAIISLLLAIPAQAQIFAVSGGSSTLMSATGGQVTAYLPGSTSSVSVGEFNGNVLAGASEEFLFHGWDTTVGDKELTLLAGNEGVTESFIGASVTRRNSRRRISVFAGAVGNLYTVPFGFAAQPNHFGAGASFEQIVGPLKFSSIALQSGSQRTMLQNVEYKWRNHVLLDAAGGLLQNSPVENATAMLQARGFGTYLNRQTMYLSSVRTDVTGESAFWTFRNLNVQASHVQSRAASLLNDGESVGGGLRLWRGAVSLSSNYFRSKTAAPLLVNSVTATFRRFSFTESEFRSNGQTSFATGGSWMNNSLSASISHQVLYYPMLRNPWQQTLSVTISIRWRNASGTISTLALPNGSVKYGVYGSNYLYGDQAGSENNRGPSIGRFTLSGTVSDEKGTPVSGAALQIGKQVIYSGDDGTFAVRVSKSQPYAFSVLPEEFVMGSWETVSAPDSIETGKPISVVVRQVVQEQSVAESMTNGGSNDSR